MRNVFSQLWADDAGVVGLEYLILATIIGLGLIVGVSAVNAALTSEYTELANAIMGLCQNYTSDGFSNCVGTRCASGGSGDISQPFSTLQIEFVPANNAINDDPCV